MADLEEFYRDFFQDVQATADTDEAFLESSFMSIFCDYLIDAGEFQTFDAALYKAPRGMRVDGYAGDPSESDGTLTLFISDFSPSETIESLTKTEVDAIFGRLENFFRASLKREFHESLEETSPGYGLAYLIWSQRNSLAKVRLFLISNRSLSSRVEGMESKEVEGYPITYNLWDISRLHRLVASHKGKEDVDIDLTEDFGQRLPCLQAHLGNNSYKSYLAVVPGQLLSQIYEKWGARLLEQNVRCFLQVRGGVNKGIRTTILQDPDMFFAYNNGITATAEAVELEEEDGASFIRKLKNLQIVNGGQTTASIFTTAKKDKAPLDHVFVQMKLSVVAPDKAMEVVPKISEYANSQNRVNAADFFANHPYHVRMQTFSRRIWAPSPDGSFRESKWFYERARGQYLDAKANLTPGEKKKFEQEFPKPQAFTKTDLAKFENVWEGIPHIVCKGAQFNFAHFAKLIGERWSENPDLFNEMYFRMVIAKAIIFRSVEKLVSDQPWYDGGYRAQVVAYTIAKLGDMVSSTKRSIDFEAIWKQQGISPALHSALVKISEAVNNLVTSPDAGISNVTEWAKKPALWKRVKDLTLTIPAALASELVGSSEVREAKRDAVKGQKIDNGIDAQRRVVELGAGFWSGAITWASKEKLISIKEREIMALAAAMPRKIPSEKQCLILMEVLEKLQEARCPLLTEAASAH
jgi:hypothetical protein